MSLCWLGLNLYEPFNLYDDRWYFISIFSLVFTINKYIIIQSPHFWVHFLVLRPVCRWEVGRICQCDLGDNRWVYFDTACFSQVLCLPPLTLIIKLKKKKKIQFFTTYTCTIKITMWINKKTSLAGWEITDSSASHPPGWHKAKASQILVLYELFLIHSSIFPSPSFFFFFVLLLSLWINANGLCFL